MLLCFALQMHRASCRNRLLKKTQFIDACLMKHACADADIN